MFGIRFQGHPHLERLLMPKTWVGPSAAARTIPRERPKWGRSNCPTKSRMRSRKRCASGPKIGACSRAGTDTDFMFLNVGPQHPGTHGVLRIALQLDGEEIVDAVPEIGFHHRGAEKMGERQTWHTYIPYTDRIDYLGGVMNNMAYLTGRGEAGGDRGSAAGASDSRNAVRSCSGSSATWSGTEPSPRIWASYRRSSTHSTTASVPSASSRRSAARACIPNWFRIGGVAQDLPKGWDALVRDFLKYFPPRLVEYDKEVMRNRIFKARTQGSRRLHHGGGDRMGRHGAQSCAPAASNGTSARSNPTRGYEQFEFDIPTGQRGDCYDRGMVRVEEMRQSLRIIEQCVNNMPEGPYKSGHPLESRH